MFEEDKIQIDNLTTSQLLTIAEKLEILDDDAELQNLVEEVARKQEERIQLENRLKQCCEQNQISLHQLAR